MQDKYNAEVFSVQFKKARIFRGYAHQIAIHGLLGLSRQVISLWEQGKRLPSMAQMAVIGNFFKLDINYFFTEEADPEEFVIE